MKKVSNGDGSLFPRTGFGFITRRLFLKDLALAASGLVVGPAVAGADSLDAVLGLKDSRRNNALPGRIILLHDDNLSQSGTIDYDRAEHDVAQGVKSLTGIEDTGEAFESLFSGITSSSKIAIKVNLISSTDTRWETARGVVSGLSKMLGETYDVSNVTLYDSYSMTSHGYTDDRFTFNGNTANLQSNKNCNSGIFPVTGRELSSWIVEADYVINMPVLKDHSSNGLTLGLKNHYGSVKPSNMCGLFTDMLTLNADSQIKDKTCLILLDAIFGLWTGGPGGSPQQWLTFPEENTPNSMLFGTDPVTIEYWGRYFINEERSERGFSTYSATYIEDAAEPPFSLGIANPGDMDKLNLYLDRITIEILSAPSSVARGEILRFRVSVTNSDADYPADMDNVRLDVTGPVNTMMELFSRHVELAPGQSVSDWVEISVPGNTPLGQYELDTVISYENADLTSSAFTCQVTE